MAYYYNEEFVNQLAGGGLSVTETFKNKKTKHQTGNAKIQDSIYNILSTRVGERFMLPEFGSKLYKCVFEQNNYIFKDMCIFYVKDALNKWEKRINVLEVDVDIEREGNVVPITITYQLANSNIMNTYVYPFNVNSKGNPEIYAQGTNIVKDYS